MHIREFREGDEKGIQDYMNGALRSGMFPYIGEREISNETAEKWRYSILGGKMICVVAEDNNKIVGSIFIYLYGEDTRLRHKGHIGWTVDPRYQMKGIARKMLEMAIDLARKRGLKRLEAVTPIENSASITLAKKFGFKIEGVKRKDFLADDGRYLDSYIIAKLL